MSFANSLPHIRAVAKRWQIAAKTMLKLFSC